MHCLERGWRDDDWVEEEILQFPQLAFSTFLFHSEYGKGNPATHVPHLSREKEKTGEKKLYKEQKVFRRGKKPVEQTCWQWLLYTDQWLEP